MKVEKENPEEPTLWDKVKKGAVTAFNWTMRYPVALVIAVLVIAAAVIAMMLGVGDRFNVGGILGKLFGKDDTEGRVVKANEVPSERVDKDGNPIGKGEADEHGYVQKDVVILEQPSNPFRDKSKIKIRTSDGKEKKIKLPKGVEDTDVDRVIQLQPEVFKVEVKKRPEERVTEKDLEYLE